MAKKKQSAARIWYLGQDNKPVKIAKDARYWCREGDGSKGEKWKPLHELDLKAEDGRETE